MSGKKHDLIIGVGNVLLSDDGIGVLIVRRMEKDRAFKDAEYIDMGTSSMDLGYYIDASIRKMVVIDTIKSDERPGTIYRLGPEDLASKDKRGMSLHQLKLIDTLKLIDLDSGLPETAIIGIVPADVKTCRDELSAELKEAFDSIYEKVVKAAGDFLK